jgi:hypothetical protein
MSSESPLPSSRESKSPDDAVRASVEPSNGGLHLLVNITLAAAWLESGKLVTPRDREEQS